MSSNEYQWCSWCHKKTTHILVKKNYLSRNEYQCSSCGNYTVQCRYCQNMATYKPAESENNGFFSSIKENWASELCAEHDGTIANFEKLNVKLSDLSEFEVLFERAKWNLVKTGKIAGCMIAGAAVFCPLTYLAPGIASALGTVIRNTAINASLAVLGPGGMDGGIVFISAIGKALGGTQGAVISNNYFGAIKDFKITKVKQGSGPALIFINGFLSQKNQDPTDWINAVSDKYPSNPYYYVNWGASSLYQAGSFIGKKIIIELVKRGSILFAQRLNPLNWAQTVATLFGNPWHASMVKASMTGILLADLIARTNNPDGFILMGHSLGARVIYYLLCALATKNSSPIHDVFLLGGAVDRKDTKGWKDATRAVKGRIINCYSNNDSTLKFLYQGANALLSSPIGLGDIEVSHDKIVNKDVTSIIAGHMQYNENFGKILKKI